MKTKTYITDKLAENVFSDFIENRENQRSANILSVLTGIFDYAYTDDRLIFNIENEELITPLN